MVGEISYPRYSYSQIQSAAAAFLGKYHPGGIVPMPGLHRAFDTDGFTTSDLTAIYVEDYVYSKPMVEPDAYQDFLGECLGQEFEVSPEAAVRRLKKWNELNRR